MPARKRIGIDLRDRHEQCALAAPDQVAGFHLRRADQPVDGRVDRRVAEVVLGLLQRGLLGIDLSRGRVPRRQRIVEFLLADRLLRHQRRVAVDVVLRLLEPRLGGGELSLRVGHGRLQVLRVDLVEPLALRHQRALRERHCLKEPLDAGPDLDVLEASRLAHQFHPHRHVPLDGLDHHHFRRRRRGRWRLFRARRHRHEHDAAEDQD